MTIKISASSIKDYLVCSQRNYYRINYSGEGVQSKELLLGSLIHKVIEEFWDKQDKGLALVRELSVQYPIVDAKKFKKCVDNFYIHFSGLLESTDEIEKEFTIKHTKDVSIVGRMDRISDGTIFDWKSTERPPNDVEDDLQFILYYDAYKEIYKKTPSVFYASLMTGDLIRFKYNTKYADILYKKIIPEMVSDIKSGNFYRKGILAYGACTRCVFKTLCYKELGEEK
jgi:hypothetical protein